MKKIYLLLIVSFSTNAMACLDVESRYGRSQICTGSEVYLQNSSGEGRTGTVQSVFSNGRVKIRYYHGGSYEVWRTVSEISPAVSCLPTRPSRTALCEADGVALENSSGEKRYGKATKIFLNGQVRVDYYFSGNYTVYRDLSAVSKEVRCIRGICAGDRVHLYNANGEDREGIALNVFANGQVHISYNHSGNYKVWRLAGDVSDELHCSPLH